MMGLQDDMRESKFNELAEFLQLDEVWEYWLDEVGRLEAERDALLYALDTFIKFVKDNNLLDELCMNEGAGLLCPYHLLEHTREQIEESDK